MFQTITVSRIISKSLLSKKHNISKKDAKELATFFMKNVAYVAEKGQQVVIPGKMIITPVRTWNKFKQ